MNTPAATAPVDVDVDDRQSEYHVDLAHLSAVLASTLVDQAVAGPAEVGLAFVGVEEMTGLNQTHMGGAGPTDVLAFPIDGATAVPFGQPAMLGDIVICPEVAARAPEPLSDELALLVVHGALHLVGHDHAEPDQAAAMKALEQEMLQRYHNASQAP